ncbi:UdgX family uracil-DNA binding protein, partial [Litorisediminicola beolgyonensis]
RRLAADGTPPEAVLWSVREAPRDLFAGTAPPASGPARQLHLPRVAVDGLESALCHSDPQRFARAYRTVLRLSSGELSWGDRRDAEMALILRQAKAVGRDVHKMHAFVRFREVPGDGPRRAFAAWFEPEHPICERATPFFAKRFGDMDWIIATPTVTARFEKGRLSFEETADQRPPPEDATEDLWRTYYASIFNPARVMVKAMCAEMPKKYWKNLPEAELIPGLIAGAETRVRQMAEAQPRLDTDRRTAAIHARQRAPAPEPKHAAERLSRDLDACTRCGLCGPATQVVKGEGPMDARLMIVGEQPGDQEDLAGRPFVGPAGEVFDDCARSAGLDRSRAYITNAVKHFKFAPRGKRRIHQRPDTGEVEACRWWLDIERRLVRPRLILAMGATAAQSLTGDGTGLLRRRGTVEETPDGQPVLLMLHPSYILRLPDPRAQSDARTALAEDLAAAWEVCTT